MKQIVSNFETGKRIDRYLSTLNLPQLFSRSRVEKLFTSGNVLVNGRKVKKSYEVQTGDEIEFSLPEQQEGNEIKPEEIPLEVIYEDEYLAVINKQAGLTVHPGAGIHSETLVNALVHRYGIKLSSGGDKQRPGIVHRLDKDTSGLLLIARNDKVHFQLSDQFQKRQVSKRYLAITVGVPPEESGEIRTCMSRSRYDRRKMSVSEEGREAVSLYRVKENYGYFAMVEIDLQTGRTHQIRVHLESIGYPVLADERYNSRKRTVNSVPLNLRKKIECLLSRHIQRQALHAYKLSFRHPASGRQMEFESELPQDMKKAGEYIKSVTGE